MSTKNQEENQHPNIVQPCNTRTTILEDQTVSLRKESIDDSESPPLNNESSTTTSTYAFDLPTRSHTPLDVIDYELVTPTRSSSFIPTPSSPGTSPTSRSYNISHIKSRKSPSTSTHSSPPSPSTSPRSKSTCDIDDLVQDFSDLNINIYPTTMGCYPVRDIDIEQILEEIDYERADMVVNEFDMVMNIVRHIIKYPTNNKYRDISIRRLRQTELDWHMVYGILTTHFGFVLNKNGTHLQCRSQVKDLCDTLLRFTINETCKNRSCSYGFRVAAETWLRHDNNNKNGTDDIRKQARTLYTHLLPGKYFYKLFVLYNNDLSLLLNFAPNKHFLEAVFLHFLYFFS